MNVKKLTLGLAAIMATSCLAACTDTDQKISFKDYWYKNVLDVNADYYETLEYKVIFQKGAGYDSLAYTLSYGEGTYVTTLEGGVSGNTYKYTTTLTLPVTYQYGSEKLEVTDTVTTEVFFLNASNALKPISSSKHVVSHTPVSLTSAPKSLSNCYSKYDFEVKTEYPASGKATTTATYQRAGKDPLVQTSSFTASDEKFSYLDNEQLLLALRAISPSLTSGSVKIFSPYEKTLQTIDLSFGEKTGKEFTYDLTENGESKTETKNISYRAASIVIDAKNPGATQTAWIATADNASDNAHRNVMLRLETPLSYSLGNLVYTLTKITR